MQTRLFRLSSPISKIWSPPWCLPERRTRFGDMAVPKRTVVCIYQVGISGSLSRSRERRELAVHRGHLHSPVVATPRSQSLQSGRTVSLSSLLLEHEIERWREVFLTLEAAFQNSRLDRGPAIIQELWQKTRTGELLGRLVLTLAKEVETAVTGYMD